MPLAKGGKTGKPRDFSVREMCDAIFYKVKNGCTWRALPGDFPKWNLVRYYFDQWMALRVDGYSLLEQALKKSGQARAYRESTRRKDELWHRGFAKREERGYGATERV